MSRAEVDQHVQSVDKSACAIRSGTTPLWESCSQPARQANGSVSRRRFTEVQLGGAPPRLVPDPDTGRNIAASDVTVTAMHARSVRGSE